MHRGHVVSPLLAARMMPQPSGFPRNRPPPGLAGLPHASASARWDLRALWLIGSVAVAAVIWFDLRVDLPANDDWLYAWSVGQLAAGHGLRIMPEQSALALVQVVWAALVTAGHAALPFMRLSLLPFVLLASVSNVRLARQLGADHFWALLAGVTLLGAPIYLSLASSFMTEAIYLGLLLAAAAFGARWIKDGRGVVTCSTFAALAALQRQSGIGIAAALTAGLFVTRRRRSIARREWVGLAGLWAVDLLALVFPSLVGVQTGAHRFVALFHPNSLGLVRAVSFFPPLLGLIVAPFLLALVFRIRTPSSGRRRWGLLPAVLAELGLLNVAVGWLQTLRVLPGSLANAGNYFSATDLGPLTLAGTKVPIYPIAAFLGVETIAVATFVAILLAGWHDWTPARVDAQRCFLIALAATQLLPMLQGDFFDRYFLPVIAPLIPLVAALASGTTRPGLAKAWAAALLGVGIGLYVVGEQDYQAWQVARDSAAQLAYRQASIDEVDAGYEANARYWEVPLYERTGKPVGPMPSDVYGEPSLTGPPGARLRLEFAGPDDPRPGVAYQSLAPGRVVIGRVP